MTSSKIAKHNGRGCRRRLNNEAGKRDLNLLCWRHVPPTRCVIGDPIEFQSFDVDCLYRLLADLDHSADIENLSAVIMNEDRLRAEDAMAVNVEVVGSTVATRAAECGSISHSRHKQIPAAGTNFL